MFYSNQGKSKGLLQGDLVETPTYIEHENLKLDYLYYIKKQLQTPIEQLFEYIDHGRVKKIFKKHINRGEMNKKGIKGISAFLKRKPKNEDKELTNCLFSDDEEEPQKKVQKKKIPKKEKKVKPKKSKKLKKPKKVIEDIENSVDTDLMDLLGKCSLFDEPKKRNLRN